VTVAEAITASPLGAAAGSADWAAVERERIAARQAAVVEALNVVMVELLAYLLRHYLV